MIMDEFCGTTFWNQSLSWYTDDPDLTPCFQKTILVWVPCLFLWVWAPLETYYILSSKTKGIPWSWKNCLKLFITLILIILSLGDLAFLAIQNNENINGKVDYYTPCLKIITFILNGCFINFNRIKGLRTSGLLFIFWLLMSIFGAVQFRSLLIHSEMFQEESQWPFISYIIQYAFVLIMLLTNCFADEAPSYSEYLPVERPCPEQSASFLSKIFFAWFDSLAWLGFKKPLETTDLWSMNPDDTSAEVVPAFDKQWEKTLRKSINVSSNEKATFRKVDTSIDITPTPASKRYQASILPALCRTFGPTFLFGALLKLFQDTLLFIQPQLLKLLIEFVDSGDPLWKGFCYAVGMFLTASFQTLILAQYFNRMNLIGLRIRTALISTIYRKALRLSNNSRKESTVGEIVNLMSVDAQRFMDLMTYINMIWSAPFQIIVALFFLWRILGVSVLAGLAVMIIMIPINGWVASRVRILQIRQMKCKDERVKLMNEVLSGIKVLKLFAWEPSFENLVLKIRNKELGVLRQAAYLYSSTTFIWSCAPFLVSLVSFATFVLSDENNVLDSKTAFVSLSLFNILRFPLSMLPMLISNMVQVSVSVKRINKFLNADELDPNFVTHKTDEKDPIVIENGTFSWTPGEEPTLKNINLHCRHGSLVAVVGAVGTGKSSLISALLGEMEKITGKVNVKGSIAYVSQQAWIQNATLKDNILFGKSFESSTYPRIVEACALKPDIEMLPAGDQTEIGEKGINLSGGQKQRVSLARAVYNDADIYYLDDPLSAVDSHVGKHIFENVIGPTGILKKKTRILVTHSITYLSSVDHIIVLKDGEISEFGTYKELLEKKGAFAEFLIQYLQNDVGDDGNTEQDLDEIKQQLENTLGSEELKKTIMRVRSRNSESESLEPLSRQNSLKRQTSFESGDNSTSRKASVDQPKAKETAGEKLIEAEKAEVGGVKWNVYSHYIKSIGLVMTVSTLAFNVMFQGFSIGSNVWLSIWSSNIGNSTDTATRDMYLGVYGALGIGQAVFTVVGAVGNFLGSLRASSLLHGELLQAVLGNPLSFFDVTPVGRILNRFAKDVDTVDTVLPHNTRSWTMCLFSVIATLVVISTTTPLFIVVIIPVGLIYFFVQRFYVATSRQLKRIESISRSPIYSHFGETITGAPIIRAFNVSKRFVAESECKVDFNQVCYYPSIIANRWLAVRLEMVGNLIIFFASLFAVLGKGITAGMVGLSVSYALQITQTLNWLVRMTSDVETNIVAVERIKEYRETKQEAPWIITSKEPPQDWPSRGDVEFQNYKVRYREGLELVLKGISFKVKGGEKVGIVGRTGAGKSSLTLCLFRIIEAASGTILIDGIDISKLGLHQLRSKLTIIPQDPVLFSGTLRLNLDPFGTHSDEEIWKALEHAHLLTFVRGMAAGLNHEVSEGGENLSVGQRQLICLARALLRKTKVLILDEATAAVDLETDDLIQRTIRTEFKGCTVLTIAHRLNTIMDSDRVIVLDKGYIIEFDSPNSLLEKKESTFYSMAKDAGLI